MKKISYLAIVLTFITITILNGCGASNNNPATPSPTPTVSLTPTPTPDLTIYDLRDFNSTNHPADGDSVTLKNVIVTAVKAYGNSRLFIIQAPEGGPFSGIYIFCGTKDISSLNTGDKVTVTGTYTEYNGLSEIVMESFSIQESGITVTPKVISDPADIATGGIHAEEYESVLIQISNISVINANPDAPNDYGEFTVTGGLRVDDLFYLITPHLLGQPLTSITGILTYNFGNYKIEPRAVHDFFY